MSSIILKVKKRRNLLEFFSLECLVGYIWIMPLLIQMVSGVFGMFMGNTALITAVFYLMMAVFILAQKDKILNSITARDLLFWGMMAISALITFIAFPQNTNVLMKNISMWPMAFALYMIGKIIPNAKGVMRQIYKASRIGIIVAAIAYFTSLHTTTKYMSFAYSVLPSVLGVAAAAFQEKKVSYWVFFGIGCALQFLLGTRGPILFIVIYFIYKMYKFCDTPARKAVLFGGAVIAGGVVVTKSYMPLLQKLYDFLLGKNYKSTILYLFLTNNTASMDGRGVIAKTVLSAVLENPLVGHGLCGDTIITGGAYSHNILIEIVCGYGLVIGSILILAGVCYFISVYKASGRKYEARELLILTCASFMFKLFFSATYVGDLNFYFAMGIFSGIKFYSRRHGIS